MEADPKKGKWDRRRFLKVGSLAAGGAMVSALPIKYIANAIEENVDTLSFSLPFDTLSEIEDRHPFVRDTQIGNTKLTLCGVDHRKSQFTKWSSFYEDLIKGSSGIVSEASLNDISNSADEEFKGFYSGIFELCKKYRKPVFYLEPHSSESKTYETMATVGDVTTVAAGATIIARSSSEAVKKKISPKMTAGLFALGTLGLILSLGRSKASYVLADAGPALYDQLDFRNICVSEGLPVVPSCIDNPVKITAFYGYMHVGPIDRYLQWELLRKIKREFYEPIFNKDENKPKLQKYVFEKDEWKTKLTLDI